MAKQKEKTEGEKPEINLDDVIEMILQGQTYRQIAENVKKPLSTLHDFLARDEHSARVKEAFQISADSYADLAEEALKGAKSTIPEIQRARELAQHYRWKASKRAPKKYGDKLDVTTDGEKINQKPIIIDWSNDKPSNDKTDTEAT